MEARRIVFLSFLFLHSEGKESVVIREDGHSVDYTSAKDEVKHLHFLNVII